MIFRGSSAGYCSRSIVAKELDPSLREVEPSKRPFLDAGHYLQEQVEDFLTEVLPGSFSLLTQWRESEGVHNGPGFQIVGHVDGVLFDKLGENKGKNKTGKYYLLEVKAIKEQSYKKLQKTHDWREMYASYQFQAQTYLHFPKLIKSAELVLAKEFEGTHFVYYNRNTSHMMTSLPIVHPAVERRDDMYEPKDGEFFSRIMDKFKVCAEAIEQRNVPEQCDAVGYCFFCGTSGTGFTQVSKRRRVSLQGDDPEQQELEYLIGDYNIAAENIDQYFTEFKADEIELESGVVIKKEDVSCIS